MTTTTHYRAKDITVTALGSLPTIPLTTFFTPPPDCTNPSAYVPTTWADGHIAYQLLSGALRPTCQPVRYKTLQYEQSQWYSPGVCPTKFEYVATSRGVGNDGGVTTFAVCCPPGLHTVGTDFSCTQVITEGGDLSFQETGKGATAFGNPVSVAWKEDDLDLFSPASAPLLALSSAGIHFPTATTGGSITLTSASATPGGKTVVGGGKSTSSSTSGSTNNDSGLSTGAAAGIGVGATVAGLALLGGLWLLLRRYRLSRKDTGSRERGHEEIEEVSKPPPSSEQQSTQYGHYAPKREMFEAPPESQRHEADAGNVRAELDAGWQAPEVPGHGQYTPVPVSK